MDYMKWLKNYSTKNIVEYINGEWHIEMWRTIPNSKYLISSFGRIKRKSRIGVKQKYIPEIIRKVALCGKYLRVGIHDRNYSIHRLVCTAFHPNLENKPQVNHKDANKWNNFYLNLEWATQSENNKHAVENDLCWQKGLKNINLKTRKYIKSVFGKVDGDLIAKQFGITYEQVYTIGTNRDSSFLPTIKVSEIGNRKKQRPYEPNYKPIIDLQTGIFWTSSELAKIHGTTRKKICKMLSGERKNNMPQYRYA